jgi:hypothetical protein
MRRNISDLALGAAIVLSYTTTIGGLNPDGRVIALGLILLAALSSNTAMRPALWGPALAAVASLAVAPIPGLGWETVFQLFFFAAAGSVLGGALDRPIVSGSLLLAGTALALSVIAEAAGHFALLGRNGLGLGAAGFLMGANVSAIALAAALSAAASLFAGVGGVTGATGAAGASGVSGAEEFAGGAAAGQVGPRRFLSIAAGIVIASGIVLTGSRTGLIAAAAGLIPLAIQLPPRFRRALFAGFIGCLFAGAFLYLPRFLAKLDPAFITNAQRFSMIHGVFDAAAERPFAGFGPGAFPILGQRFLTWPKWELHPHSLPLRILFESGLVGVIGWGWLVVSAMRGAKRALKESRALSLSVACALAAGSVTDDALWIPALGAIFFLAVAGLFEVGATVAGGGGKPRLAGGERRAFPARAAMTALIAITGIAAGILPALEERVPGIAFAPNLRAIDRAVERGDEPDFAGWREDPMSLRVGAYARWSRGDRSGAIELVERARALDPSMILGPHLLDRVWMEEARGDTAAARRILDEARRVAPVLTARYCGETTASERSWIDRHYGIEFPDASIITAKTMIKVEDPLDWRRYRYEAAAAWERGDTNAARSFLERASTLAASQYGRDPVLLRLRAALYPEAAAALLKSARIRSAPSYPYRVFAPLVYRRRPATTGENSPWWSSRMEWEPPKPCP